MSAKPIPAALNVCAERGPPLSTPARRFLCCTAMAVASNFAVSHPKLLSVLLFLFFGFVLGDLLRAPPFYAEVANYLTASTGAQHLSSAKVTDHPAVLARGDFSSRARPAPAPTPQRRCSSGRRSCWWPRCTPAGPCLSRSFTRCQMHPRRLGTTAGAAGALRTTAAS